MRMELICCSLYLYPRVIAETGVIENGAEVDTDIANERGEGQESR